MRKKRPDGCCPRTIHFLGKKRRANPSPSPFSFPRTLCNGRGIRPKAPSSKALSHLVKIAQRRKKPLMNNSGYAMMGEEVPEETTQI